MSEAPTVAFVGSSSMEPSSPLPAALAAELGLRPGQWVALGRRGSRLADWTRASLPSGLRAIVVLLTANDARPTSAAVREVDRALRTHAPSVVWLPPFHYRAGSPVSGRDAAMRAALEASGVTWLSEPTDLAPSVWAHDGVHLTAAGYRAYARQVAGGLRRATAPAARVIGVLHTGGGKRLPLTSLDALWLARALVGEGGGEADAMAITSTMLRRWALLQDAQRSSPFRTLTDLVVGRFVGADPYDGEGREVAVRGYSQPVAVQWRSADVPRRRRIRELGWSDIEPWRREIVIRLLTGAVSLVARPAVHFAAPRLVREGLERRAGDWQHVPVTGAANRFISTQSSRRAIEPTAVALDPPRSDAVSSRGYVVVAGALALVIGLATLRT